MSKIKQKLELLEEINKYAPIIKDINGIANRVIVDEEEKNSLLNLTKKIEKWKQKLSNPKFEVAIIGLEKAGKSTMANALLNKNFLPEAKARCTFTTATIESDDSKDEAVIEFYTKSEFLSRFNGLCEKIKLDKLDFDALTLYELQLLVKEKDYYQKPKELLDIEIMVKNKETLNSFIGKKNEVFEENIQDNVKPYIVDEDRSMAVKSITIKSTELKDMQDLIIYDVPGFDSPTKLHLEQAKKYADEADVIIMMVSIAERVSFLDAQVDFLNQTAKDGVSLIDKTITVASRWDGHIIPNDKDGSTNEITEYMDILHDQLKQFNIYREENVFMVNPRGYLEKNGKIEQKIALPKLESVNLDDGFENFRNRLSEFFKYDALKALNDTIKKDINSIQNFLIDFKRKHNIEHNEAKLREDEYNLKKGYKDLKSKELLDKVVLYKDSIQNQGDYNINEDLKSEIHTKWIEILKITDNKRENDTKKISNEGIERVGHYNSKTREHLYRQSLRLLTELVSGTLIDKDKAITDQFKKDTIQLFGIKNNTELSLKLETELEQIMGRYAYDEKSYKPLMSRFINDVFKLLISYPIPSNREGERIKAFKEMKLGIESLLLFDKDNYENEAEFGIYEKYLVKKMLVQYEDTTIDKINSELEKYKKYFQKKINISELAEDIKGIKLSPKRLSKILEDKKKNFEDIAKDGIIKMMKESKSKNSLDELIDYANEATSYKEVQIEINKDLDNLQMILSDVVLKAMMIEKPFLDSLNTQIESIRLDLTDEKNSILDKFMDINIQTLDRENYHRISGDPELNQRISNILSSIEEIK